LDEENGLFLLPLTHIKFICLIGSLFTKITGRRLKNVIIETVGEGEHSVTIRASGGGAESGDEDGDVGKLITSGGGKDGAVQGVELAVVETEEKTV
jgi:hypothetical protein